MFSHQSTTDEKRDVESMTDGGSVGVQIKAEQDHDIKYRYGIYAFTT
jgi:hypothetical protein